MGFCGKWGADPARPFEVAIRGSGCVSSDEIAMQREAHCDGARLWNVKRFCLALAVALSLSGQTVEQEMSADRPGFRNSTHLVGPGVVQMETGLSLTADHVLSMEPEFRIGALRWLELRVRTDSVVLRSSPGSGLAGTSDLQPGIKFPLVNDWKDTRVVAILKSSVPSGHGSQTTGGYQPGAEIIWEHKLTEDFSLAGTLNATRRKEERFVWERAASVSMNKSLGKHLRTFAEIYVIEPRLNGRGNQWSVDAGAMRVLSDFVMLDLAAAHSLHGPNDWLVTVGVSVRTRVPHFHR